jgi:hypothetical protein
MPMFGQRNVMVSLPKTSSIGLAVGRESEHDL